MGISTRSGKWLALAAALAWSVAPQYATGQEGYHEVRVNTDNVACGTVVLKWPLGDASQTAGPAAGQPAANQPGPGNLPPPPKPIGDPNVKLEMAEVTPVPVIHAHPGLNAGSYWLPPADGLYRHYSPELQPPPPMWLYNRAVYERRLKEKYDIDYQVPPGSVGQFKPGELGPIASAPGVYVIQDGRQIYLPAGGARVPAARPQAPARAAAPAFAEPTRRVTAVQPVIQSAPTPAPAAAPAQPAGESAPEKEGAPISLPCPNFVLFGVPCGVEGPPLVAPCSGAGPCGQIMQDAQTGVTFGDWVSSPTAPTFPDVVDVYEPKD